MPIFIKAFPVRFVIPIVRQQGDLSSAVEIRSACHPLLFKPPSYDMLGANNGESSGSGEDRSRRAAEDQTNRRKRAATSPASEERVTARTGTPSEASMPTGPRVSR